MMFFNYYKIIIIQLFFSLLFFTVKAQEITTIENVTRENKLQNHTILCITQDTQGFLWIGTNSGLYKYDGYNFKEYLVNTKPSIINVNVKALLIEGDNLWIGTKGGITILNTKTNKSESFNYSTDNVLSNDYVTKLFKDINNNIWVGYFSNKISKHTGDYKFQHYDLNIDENNECYSVRGIVETKHNTLYLKMVCETSKSTTILEAKSKSNSLKTAVITGNIEDKQVLLFSKDSSLYVVSNNKLYNYSSKNKKYKFIKKIFNKDTVQNSGIYIDRNSKIYIGTKKNSFYNFVLFIF